MRKALVSLAAAAALVLCAASASAQTQLYPIPSGVGTAGQAVVFKDGNNIQGSNSISPTTLQLGSGTALTKIVVYSTTVTPGSVAANGCAWQSFTVTGLTTSDKVIINSSVLWTPAAVGARVSAADLLAVNFCNSGNGAASPAGATLTTIAIRS